MRFLAALVTAAALAAGFGDDAAAQSPAPPSGTGVMPAPLAVPYLAQSELLCGGAALAMVERWWGRRGVYPADFAALVRPALGGIRTADLAAAAEARGWDIEVPRGPSPALVRQYLRDRIPVVALIQVARARYHFVVLLAWGEGRVVYHDPAGTPFTVSTEAGFLERWDGADHWALVIRPRPAASGAGAGSVPVAPPPAEATPCPPWIDQALDAAAADRFEAAAELLANARRSCPEEPVVLRELAAVRFKQGRPGQAVQPAMEYTALIPGDALGWQILAASRYLSGDPGGALAAWNETGRPAVDLIRIDGARTIRFAVLEGAMDVRPGSVLTGRTLALARRRLADIPAVRRSAVAYEPVPGGLAELRASVVERPVMGRAGVLIVGGVIRALGRREVGVEVATPTGAGELFTAGWRWEGARPRGVVRAEWPFTAGIPGVVTVDGAWEEFRFAAPPAPGAGTTDSRRVAGLGFGGWISGAVRPSVGVRLDRWAGGRTYLPVTAGTEARLAGDRLALGASVEWAVALTPNRSYQSGSLRAEWTSAPVLERLSWSGRIGLDWTGASAPAATWPVAGGNVPWALELRGHPPTSDGRLSVASIGRRIVSAGLAADRPVLRVGPLAIAAGLFLDGASIGRAEDPAGIRHYLDGGGGIRIGLGGGGGLGVLQIDLATGLLDRGPAVLTIGLGRGRRGTRPSSW